LLGVTYTATGTGNASGFTAAGAGDINDVVNLPGGSTITYQATGRISPAAAEAIFNSASVTSPSGTIDPNPSNDTGTDMDFLVPAADVSVVMTAAPGPRRVRYTITVRNLGPADAENVVLSDRLPPQTVFVAQAQTSGPAFVLGNNGNQITNTIDLLPTGATATFLVFATARRGRILNVASVSSVTPDLAPGNNIGSVATLVGNKNQRWLSQVYRDLIKREIGGPALKNGEKFLSQPGDPRTLRTQYLRKLLNGLVYFARISHDYYEYYLDRPTSFADCVKSLDFLAKGGSPEQLRAQLFGGPEYFEENGGNNAGWAGPRPCSRTSTAGRSMPPAKPRSGTCWRTAYRGRRSPRFCSTAEKRKSAW
jgi:uncharacterized repeat protein (TIGR01451 family)